MTLHLIDDKTAPKSQRFRWQLKGRNGKIVAASSEGFSSKRGCAQNAADAFNGFCGHVNPGRYVMFKDHPVITVRQ